MRMFNINTIVNYSTVRYIGAVTDRLRDLFTFSKFERDRQKDLNWIYTYFHGVQFG